jgi:hypothetical protein
MRWVLWGTGSLAVACAIGFASQACDSVTCTDLRDPSCLAPSPDGAADTTTDQASDFAIPVGADTDAGAPPKLEGGDANAGDGSDVSNAVFFIDGGPDVVDATEGFDARDGFVGSDAFDGAAGFDGFDGFACDPTKSPHDAPCVIDPLFGVFVSPAGRDTAAGTMSDPLRTITEGVAKAVQTGKARVYTCDGIYSEHVVLSSPVSLYGGLTCPGGGAGWSYDEGGTAQVNGPPNEIALAVSGVATPIAIEDFRIFGAAASGQDDAGNGLSSVGALVNASTITFRRCWLSAGGGDRGDDGTAGINYAVNVAPSGAANDGGMGGAGASVQCVDGTSSTSGNGGGATIGGAADGGNGVANPMPPTEATMRLDGLGGSGGFACTPGDKGAYGAAGHAGAAATVIGVLTVDGWTPTRGGSGQAGHPGQGGGGGGGVSGSSPLGGTGGGAGGCGGAGGTGGAGGGASIALACVASSIALDGCTLTTAAAGAGGKGGDGQAGQGGGSYGAAVGPCLGGYGGNGAGGSAGAGGTGGASACIAYRGSAPTGSPNCIVGAGGTPGAGGRGLDGGSDGVNNAAPAGANGADGLAGVSQQLLSL